MSEHKFQYSQFDNIEGQYVVRTDDQAEFKELVKMVKLATGRAFAQAPVKQNSAPQSGDKPKVPYMWLDDTCPVCNRGSMVKTVKESKTGEKYNALICDQKDCRGYAYISKYSKPFAATGNMPINEENPLPDEMPF